MRILILFTQPWKVGGAETHVEALLSGWQKHEVTLAVNQGSQAEKLAALKARLPQLEIIEIQARGANPWRWWQSLQSLRAVMRDRRIQYVSAQQRTAGVWAWYLRKVTGVPFLVTMHDSWHRALAKSRYGRLFPKLVLVGHHLQPVAQQQFAFAPEQLVYIHNGVDFSRFQPQAMLAARQRLGLPAGARIVLHVSRLSSVKGAVALALLECLPVLLLEQPQLVVHIVGEGPLRAKIEAAACKLNEQWQRPVVVCHDFTNAIVQWYQAADVIVGEGRVAIESLACEKPVVAIRNGRQFFGLVTPQNVAEAVAVNFDGSRYAVTPQQLAAEIAAACQLEPAACAQAAAYIRENLDIPSMAAKYEAALRQCGCSPERTADD